MLLVKPYLGCNLACSYCYEGRYRKKTHPKMEYNLELILKKMEEFKGLQMTLHGGEPLAMPKKDVAILLGKMKELTGHSGVQTNATLIDDDFIQIFKEQKTSIGISWDGPDQLSQFRPRSEKVGKTIEKLIKEGLQVSLIAVISKANAGNDQLLGKFKNWLLELEKMKICGRLNPCYGAPEYQLDEKRMKEAYLDLADFCLLRNLRWSPFTDIIKGLQGKERVCTLMGCDIFSTPSATVLLGDGSITNCMRTNQEGILLRHPAFYNTRDQILSQVPQIYGGCQNCSYWSACHGGCPMSGLNNDWRNRSGVCSTFKALFQFYEKILDHCGFSANPCQAQGQPPKEGLVEIKPGWLHGDHEDSQARPGGGHGDVPHGDAAHGDHEDSQARPGGGHGDAAHGDHEDNNRGSLKERTEIKSGSKYGDSAHGDWPDHKDSG